MKYKFRLSIKYKNKLVPINLGKLSDFEVKDITEIKTIDDFTTKFSDLSDLLYYLKIKELIPQYTDKLYITFDVLKNGIIEQQLYSYNKTIFYKDSIDKLNRIYIYKLIMLNMEDGQFISKIIKHYKRKYTFKNFTTLESISRIIRECGISALSPDSKKVYIEELEKLYKFVFYKKNGNENYKNIRDFICYLSGECPIRVKRDNGIKDLKIFRQDATSFDIEYENICIDEWSKCNKYTSMNPEIFEPYQDGNDYCKSLTSEEIEECLNDYARKLTLKRDNGEYE